MVQKRVLTPLHSRLTSSGRSFDINNRHKRAQETFAATCVINRCADEADIWEQRDPRSSHYCDIRNFLIVWFISFGLSRNGI